MLDARHLVGAAAEDRLGAVVSLLFVQGWRVAEALGLGWEDLDVDAGVAIVRRAAIYVHKGRYGARPDKERRRIGHPPPVNRSGRVVRVRRKAQAAERLACREPWPTYGYEGRAVSLVFTNERGGVSTGRRRRRR